MILHLLRMRINVSRNICNDQKNVRDKTKGLSDLVIVKECANRRRIEMLFEIEVFIKHYSEM